MSEPPARCVVAGWPRGDGRLPVSGGTMVEIDRPAIAPPPRGSLLDRLLSGAIAFVGATLGALRRARKQRVVAREATRLEQDGGLVFGDAEGWPRPPNIHGFVPCVYAVFEDGEVVLRLTDPEVKHEGERRSHQAFAAWAEAAPDREYEHLPV